MGEEKETIQKEQETAAAPQAYASKLKGSNTKPPGWWFLIFGVVFPTFVLLLELTTRMCAQQIFDPIPGVGHFFLIAAVPAANLAVWYSARRGFPVRPKLLGIANGMAIGIGLFYTLLFLPILPLAVLAIAAFGLGLLPMAPLFSLIASIRGHYHLRRLLCVSSYRGVRGTTLGLIACLGVIALLDLPGAYTRVLMAAACSEDASVRSTAISALRVYSDNDVMVRACYLRPYPAVGPLGMVTEWVERVRPEKAQELYFRVNGSPFNSVPPPKARQVFYSRRPAMQFDFDPDQGGELVGRRIHGLSLESSRLDGSVDAEAALAYLEWTLEFKNESEWFQEARTQIELPPGGVVSRATLWVNGVEREAAFASRNKAQQAYQKVVRRRRDPLLVTTSGPDRVLVQCFPVPKRGGIMKIRVGMTVPLTLEKTDLAALRLPRFLERNFAIGKKKRHLVWIESTSKLTADTELLIQERPSNDLFAVRGDLTDRALTSSSSVIKVGRSSDSTACWAEDPSRSGAVVVQRVEAAPSLPIEHLVLVVDGSASMSSYGSRIAATMSKVPAGVEVSAIVASDQPEEISETTDRKSEKIRETIARNLASFRYVGGRDNVPALAKAWDVAARTPRGAIVWIHGPQPVLLAGVEVLRQKWERRPDGPRLFSFDTRPGPNRIMEKLDGIPSVGTIPRLGLLEEDLERLFSSFEPNASTPTFRRERLEQPLPPELTAAKKTSAHLARLWAYDQVRKLASANHGGSREQALALASEYNLVTPVSGAVVLENDRQYKSEGLTPASPKTVPGVPEPETWVLIIVTAAVLVWVAWRRRLAWAAF